MPKRIVSIVLQDNLGHLTHAIYALHALSVVMGDSLGGQRLSLRPSLLAGRRS